MQPFELVYLGRTKFHLDQDALAMYFRVLRNGRYVGAYAGAVSGPDMTALQSPPNKRMWAALAHATTGAIGVRLLGGVRTLPDHQTAETIWIKSADLRVHMQASLPLPVEDEVFTTFALDEDPLMSSEDMSTTRILSVGSTSISLKAAASTPIEQV